ncbi:hypothetical protein DE146DRAFT_730542 [Phaeosphaeria sp. MPI-PUGE-AT-0046c]|nr:hypothetical protein DE146DRAFT_730542 [Phaeosphaeria sp. MPI-PUGE-AT-0046c]
MSSPPPGPQSRREPSTPPSQDIPLSAQSTSPGSKASLIHAAQEDCASFSPADCRTLKKIINDVQSPSPATSTNKSEQVESVTSVDPVEEESSDTGCEDQVTYTEEQHDHGDEASDGYEDEDKSMELSDGMADEVEEVPKQEEQGTDSTDELEYVWSDGDTIEDIMNLPGTTAPPARHQDLGGILVHDQLTSEECNSVKKQRAAIEEILEAERLEHGRQESAIGEVGIDAVTLEHEDDDIDLSRDPEVRATETIQVEMCMSFTPYATIPDTPFTKTLNYYKQHKGKENSPAKTRRNASLPEEIAEMAKEAIEEEDLEQYREMDLAPMEPEGESDTMGDLMTFSTHVKSTLFTNGTINTLLDLSESATKAIEEDSNEELPDRVAAPEAGTVGLSSSPEVAHVACALFSDHNYNSDADTDCSDAVSEHRERQLILAPEHPTFVKVIELLPAAMMYQVVAPIAHYSNKAYEALVDKLHGLGL